MAPPSVSRRPKSVAPPVETPTGLFGFSTPPALLCFAALWLWLFLAPMQWSGVRAVPGTSLWPQALVLVCAAISAVFAAISRQETPRFGAVAWFLSLFLGWSFLSVFTASYPHDAWIQLAGLTGALAFFFLIRLFPSPSHRLALVGAAVLGLAWPGALALFDFTQTHNTRQFGSYMNPNWFATALAMGLPLALVLPLGIWSYTRQKVFSVVSAIPLVILLMALAVTSSKGGLLAAFVALIVTVITLRIAKKAAFGRAFKRLLPVIAIGVIVFGLLAAKTVLPRLIQTRGTEDNSTQFRAYLWRATVDMVKAKPIFGHGPGSFSDTYPQYALAGYTRTAHQSWLQIAAESGVPAVALLMVAIACALASGAKALRTESWPLVVGGFGAVTALLVHGCFDAGWSTPSIVLLFALAMGLLEAPQLPVCDTEKEQGLGWQWLLGVLVLALGGYGTQTVASGEDASEDANMLLKQSAPSLALQKAQLAVSLDPTSARNWVQLGRLQALANDINWKNSLQKAVDLQPNRPQNYHAFVQVYQTLSDTKGVEEHLQKTLDHDPLNTQILLERAKWRLDHKDGRALQDLNKILDLWNAPYGRYPALSDWVNLDFARAVVLIAPSLQKTQPARLQGLVKHALADTANARAHQAQNQSLLNAVGTDTSLDSNDDLDTLEAQLKELQTS